MTLEYNPPFLFWIAHYSDNTSLPQFDPEDGHENKFSDIDQSKLVRFGWYPFTAKLQKLVKPRVIVNPLLSSYEIELKPSQRLICFRQNKITMGSFRVCNCGMRWQQKSRTRAVFEVDPLTGLSRRQLSATEIQQAGLDSLGLPISGLWHKVTAKSGRKYQSAICPSCGSYNEYICPQCRVEKSKYHLCIKCGSALQSGECLKCRERPVNFLTVFRCAECAREFVDKIHFEKVERRTTVYVLGYQEIVKGCNRQTLIRIDETGNVVIGGG